MVIMVEDKLLRRRDSELIEEDVGKENEDLLNRNYVFCWPVGGWDILGHKNLYGGLRVDDGLVA